MKKRLLSVLLALTMVLGMLPMGALSVFATDNAEVSFFAATIAKPTPGETPDTTAVIPGNANYAVSRVSWQDENGNKVEGAFQSNTIYELYITFVCKDGYVLGNGFSAKINGIVAGLDTWNTAANTITFKLLFFPERTVVAKDLKEMRDALQKDNESTTVILDEDMDVVMDHFYFQTGKSFVAMDLSSSYIQKTLIINGKINVSVDNKYFLKSFITNLGDGTLTIKGSGSLTLTVDDHKVEDMGIELLSRWQYKNLYCQLNYMHNRIVVEETVALNLIDPTGFGDAIAISTGGYDIKGGVFSSASLGTTMDSTVSGGTFKENVFFLESSNGIETGTITISGGTFEEGATNFHSKNLAEGVTVYNKNGTEIELPTENPFSDYITIVSKVYNDFGFDSLYPGETADLGTADLGTDATNIEFAGYPKKLSAAGIADGWSVERGIRVFRDGIKIVDKTYDANDLTKWNLKNNIDEGGWYQVVLFLNYYHNGEKKETVEQKYGIKVKGSTIKTITIEGVGTPIIGKSPSTIDTVKSNTDGVVVKRVIWNYWTSEMGGSWSVMPSGSKFEAGKRYAVEIELQTADGYSFTAKKGDMTVYINGVEAGKSYNYDSHEFAAELEFDSVTTAEFTTQPVGGEVIPGGYYTVEWATSFTPCKITVGEYNSKNQIVNEVEYSNLTTSVDLPVNQYGYVVKAYYNKANAVYSDKITITEGKPSYKVNFLDEDDTVLGMIRVNEGETVARPEDPVKAGYTFIGWYTDGGELFDFATPITENTYLTAKFEVAATFLKGDFDADGEITVSDALAALRIAAKIVEETAEAIEIGDMDSDGKITVSDALAILRIAAKMN